MFGLAHNYDYYREYSSMPTLEALIDEESTPMLYVAAGNDPMCTRKVEKKALELVSKAGPNARVAMAVSSNGGHLGFLESRTSTDFMSFEHSWVDRVGCEWFSKVLETYAKQKQ